MKLRTVICLVLFGLILAGPAGAQKLRKRAVPAAMPKAQKRAAAAKKASGPGLRSEAYFRKRTKAMVESKWKQLFKQLR